MAFTKKKQIRVVRLLLTFFYGFFLSNTLSRYVIHGIIETVRGPPEFSTITMIVIGGLLLMSIPLSIYAIWYDIATTMLVSVVILVLVFVLSFVFGTIRIVITAQSRVARSVVTTTLATSVNYGEGESRSNVATAGVSLTKSDPYAHIELMSNLIIEWLLLLLAILATFILFRYVKTKYAPVATNEQYQRDGTVRA